MNFGKKFFITALVLGTMSVFAQEAYKLGSYKPDDFRNFYGICWTGDPDDNIEYADQMGHMYVYYQGAKMSANKYADGKKFIMESPEYGTYKRTITRGKKYPPEVQKEWETICSLCSLEKPFPDNIATGWFFVNANSFTANLDMQQRAVIDRTIEKIVANVKKANSRNPNFTFAGFAWDVPQPPGDFWAEHKVRKGDNGRQVGLEYWTGKDAGIPHPERVHDYATYSEGHLEFYRLLFERVRKEFNPKAKFIIEPDGIHHRWMRHMVDVKNPEKYMPDFIATEGSSTKMFDDKRIYEGGYINNSMLGCTTPNVYNEKRCREIAGVYSKKGAWTGWFGRFGGTGDMPHYRSIRDVPARIKLAKVVPVWENLHNIPLEERNWDETSYTSRTSQVTPTEIASLQPKTDKLFFVFLSKEAKVKIPEGYEVEGIYHTNGIFKELNVVKKNHVGMKDGYIYPKAGYLLNVGFIAKLKKL